MSAMRLVFISLLCAAFVGSALAPVSSAGVAGPSQQREGPDSSAKEPMEAGSQYEYGKSVEGTFDLLHRAGDSLPPAPRLPLGLHERAGGPRPPHQEVSTPPPKAV